MGAGSRVGLHDGELRQQLDTDDLAIVNRHQRWSLTASAANAVMLLTLPYGWLTRLDGDFFAVDYQVADATRDADDNLRHLMRQLLVIELVNHQSRYRLEANRWLSEIALLLATRYTRPVIARTQRGAEKWSRRIARVVARIEANYQQRLSLHDVAAAEFVSEAWLSRLFRKGGRRKLCAVHYRTAVSTRRPNSSSPPASRCSRLPREQGFASTRIMSDLF
ncbi:Uncharacterised protein [Raoultella planticola]|uniref:HTH araC/xylS-type domain-containing protein n=1 Tax=Raoultella planticola TaxID=575 RepID=A0A485ANU9_RAOPL|nr:Uncharacterised protein [Raoultella planticola]